MILSIGQQINVNGSAVTIRSINNDMLTVSYGFNSTGKDILGILHTSQIN